MKIEIPDPTDGDLRQWSRDVQAWYEDGASLARREEAGDVPDPDEYADYDDEAARLLIEVARELGVVSE